MAMAKWNIDKLCRPKKYMGQIMAECDCQSQLCEDRGYCMADTPSPEAIVRAALEKAADEANKVSDQYDSHPDGDGTDFAIGAHDAAVAIRSLASDPAEVAAIIKKAAGENNNGNV